jgi:glycosyltransferase involved in cell wall biosynthesis
MKIFIDARPLNNPHTNRGVGIVVRNLMREMGQLDAHNEYLLLALKGQRLPNFFLKSLQVETYRLPRFNRFDWIVDQYHIPRIMRRHEATVFLATDFNSYLLPRTWMKELAIVYDLIPFIFPKTMAEKSHLAQIGLRYNFANLRRAHRLLAISRATKNDTVRFLGIKPERIQVIYPGIDHALFNPLNASRIVHDCYGISGDYFLYVGDPEWRKNLRGVLEALAGLPGSIKLVIAGKRAPEDSQLRKWMEETGTAGRVVLPGFVPDEDLPSMYGHARGFLFPSRYEGFGLPVAEAMACGCPVITSNNSSLPEVAGDAALYVNPESPDEIRDAMMTLLSDATLCNTLRERGLLQVKQFTWERAARETLAALREADCE